MIQEIDVGQLKEAAYNPRVKLDPGMPEWGKLERSIREFGVVEPIVWNKRTGNVVGGHQRLSVAKYIGMTEVPCSVVDLSEHDEMILNTALNKIKGRWDYDKLESLLRGFDFEVATLSGFAAEEIAVILSSNEDLLADDEEDYGDWDEPVEEQITGGSYVVTLIFSSAEFAQEWAEMEGYENQIREGSSTTVIRVEE